MALVTSFRLNRRARSLTRDAQALHRTLLHDTATRCLWALPDPNFLVVQHQNPIDWSTRLPGIVDRSHTAETPRHIQWCLIGNPVKRHGGKAEPLPCGAAKQWADRLLSPAVDLHTIHQEALPPSIGAKPHSQVVHHRVLFHGDATVRDVETLDHLRTSGVGRGKAYGCGLLLTRGTA